MSKHERRREYDANRLGELSTVLIDFASDLDDVGLSLNGQPAIIYSGDAPTRAVKTLRLFVDNLKVHEEQTARRNRDTARKAARPGKIRDEMNQMLARLGRLEKELKKIDSF
jgi:hypothetical protein